MNYWLSWYHNDHYSAFELHFPWWISGTNLDNSQISICAGIKAISKEDAINKIYNCYDIKPNNIEFRFIEEREQTWTPFSDRFQKADWMVWNKE